MERGVGLVGVIGGKLRTSKGVGLVVITRGSKGSSVIRVIRYTQAHAHLITHPHTHTHTHAHTCIHTFSQMKANEMHYSKSESSIQLMQLLKTQLDPKGILNPYKVLVKK